jgi:hypothetical protein
MLKIREIEVETFKPYYRKKVSAEIDSGTMDMESKITLKEKRIDAEALARAASEDEELLTALLDEVSPQSRNSKRRYNSFKVLKMVGEASPSSLYRRWDYLEALLRSGATIVEFNTVRKHISAVKGGMLARAAYPANLSGYLLMTSERASLTFLARAVPVAGLISSTPGMVRESTCTSIPLSSMFLNPSLPQV